MKTVNPDDYVLFQFARFDLVPKCSSHFLRQVSNAYATGQCDPAMVADALRKVEDNIRLGFKKPNKFKSDPLKGLFKLHLWIGGQTLLQQMSTNILNEDGSGMRERRIKDLLTKYEGKNVDNEVTKALASAFVDGSLEDRQTRGSLTGEWVVFERKKSKNFYLTLAFHEEDDQAIWDRVCMATKEIRGRST